MDILRFITAGNVDDGKSTLIGRLLYDTGNIKSDVLQSVGGDDEVNLAFITDGLRAERAQGITIDVAYKYFTTAKRKYIITDAPGHFQYTKNLVTGASAVDAIIILIDAINGITEQTRRHSLVASFLRIPHVVVAVNKMDAMGYNEVVYEQIKNDFNSIAEKLHLKNITFIPISALKGDNVLEQSVKMDWYKGITLMQCLEGCEPVRAKNDAARFSVQYVQDDGVCMGKMLSGSIKVGDTVCVKPEQELAVVQKIIHGYDEVTESKAGENVSIYLAGKAKRGSMVSHFYDAPTLAEQLDATLCWLDGENVLHTDKEYVLRINAMETVCRITVLHKIDIHTYEEYESDVPVGINEFARVRVTTNDMVAYDAFDTLPENGRGIIIDAETGSTVGAFVCSVAG